MAQVTIELRHLLEMSNFELFDFEYPITDQTWKETFEDLFKDYFYFHEILETPDYFKHRLKTKLKMIIPRYNELYNSTLFELEPLLSRKLTETIEEDNITTGSQSNSGTSTVDNDSTSTDYPQHTNILDDIASGREVQKGNSTSSNNNNYNDSKTKDYQRIIEGFEGSQSELLKSYRETIININEMLINELKTLFILVY